MNLADLSVARAAELIRRREVSPTDLVRALLSQIDALEPAIRAWQAVDRDGALAAADELLAKRIRLGMRDRRTWRLRLHWHWQRLRRGGALSR